MNILPKLNTRYLLNSSVLLALVILLASCSAYNNFQHAFQQKVYEAQGLGGDERSEMADEAPMLAKGEPEPVWRTDLGHLEVDIIEDLPGKGVLVGLVGAEEKFGGSYYGPYVLFDEATGRELWRYKRDKDTRYLYDALFTGKALFVIRENVDGKDAQFLDLDPENGSVLWQTSIKGAHSRAVGDDHVIFATHIDGGIQIRALLLRNGSEEWATTLADEERLPVLALVGSQIIAVGSQVHAFDSATGKTNWSIQLKSPISNASNISWLEDSFLVPSENGHLQRIGLNGHIIWEKDAQARLGIIQADQNQVIAQLLETSGQSLASFSLPKGKSLWRRNIPGDLNSNILFHPNGFLALTTRHGDRLDFNVLQTSSGNSISSLPIDTNVHGPRAADRLLAQGENAVVAGETWVGALSLPESKLLWSRSITTDMTVSRALVHLRNAMTSDALKLSKEEKQRRNAAFDDMEETMQQRQLLKAAMVQRQTGLRAVRAANLRVQNWNTSQLNAYSMPAAARVSSATFDVMVSIYEAVQRGGAMAAAHRFPMELAAAERMHASAVRGRYFVRSYLVRSGVGERWGVRVVDLQTGKWTDIIISPNAFAYTGSVSAFNSSGLLYAVLTANNRIVVKGLGLDPKKWKPMQLGPYKVVEPALLAYDLDPGSFKSPDMELAFDGCAFIDKEGRFVIPPVYDLAYDFSDGRAPVNMGIRWTFVDRTGKQYVEPRLGRILPFSEGLAAFEYEDNFAGFYDTSGKVVIQPTLLFRPEEHPWWPHRASDLGRIRIIRDFRIIKAETEMYPDFYRFKNGRAVVKAEGGWTIIDRAGHFLVPPGKYEEMSGIYENFAVVLRDGLWGYVDSNGREVIAPQFELAGPFSDGLAGVTKDGRILYIRPDGSTALDLGTTYDETGRFRSGRIRVKKGGYNGFIDLSGKVVIPLVYKDAFAFSEGLAQAYFVKEGERYGNWGYIDPEGKVVVDFQFDSAAPFSNGLAKVTPADSKLYQFLRKNSRYAFEGGFLFAGSFTKDGLAEVQLFGKNWVKVGPNYRP